jgi:hypothetical protein
MRSLLGERQIVAIAFVVSASTMLSTERCECNVGYERLHPVADAPSPEQIAAWRLLLETQARVVERVEAALAERGLPPLAWYDVLWALRESPGRRLRQSELARAVIMSRSGLSRLVDRI